VSVTNLYFAIILSVRIIFPLIIVVFLSQNAFAGAVAQRQEQMKQMQEQAQYQAVQQAVAERQAAEMAAYQQAVAEYQAAQIKAVQEQIMQAQAQQMIAAYMQKAQVEAAQQAMLKQAVEQQLYNQMANQVKQGVAVRLQQEMIAAAVMQQAQRLGVRRTTDMSDAVKARAIMQAQQQQAVAQAYAGAAVQAAQYQAVQEQAALIAVGAQQQAAAQYAAQMGAAGVAASRNAPYARVNPSDVKEVTDIAYVWKKLEKNSKAWTLLIDNQAKLSTMNEFIERFRKMGANIYKQPGHYVEMLDEMSSQNPQMLLKPFPEVLQIIAVMEYDFDLKGMDRDRLALQLLGPDFYAANKRRLKR
jgi:hypothetical protein